MKQNGGSHSKYLTFLWISCIVLAQNVRSASSQDHNFVGIAPQDELYYKSSDTIKCRDGSNKFSKAQLNDDYCDCPDGTDEPGIRFLQSLQFKAKDMMDLESMHMAYLSDSMNICFLSEKTQCVGGIISQILQCALDLRSCIIGDMWNAQVDKGALTIKMSQVVGIKKRFERSMEELKQCYVKSAYKVGEVGSGLCRFWEYLNYNHYYSD